ncbi:UTP--glucose-1-phosphate uridylyltransferase-like [Dendropsophus ebraccatus]|uniref:UTP--glucose-1-phosphate uridylyltransferase-like n=1 Tax=Dendropsophus ebraccatus TaxID=150705 RepID=UPI003831DF78
MSSLANDLSKAMSGGGMSQFQEAIREELEEAMKLDLEKILSTAPESELEHTKKDLEGFQKLFHRFLQEKGPSVDWGKIQKPPEDSHSHVRVSWRPVSKGYDQRRQWSW